ncbi:GCN5 family acetyltransferase [Burkholderia gladioli]|uniref:GNAT family N-acetyltransferase n=1 Tax=Burkholderia gladioli TaxID=28095 RepID=UPI00075B4FF4|nr:GNAT family N-acetyltransferase [Burkholderia gladioli]KVM65300.1 GCN5 family acetyltransferase [Burkholderia gladioli]
MERIEVETGDWTRLGADAARIRDAVFVREQRIAPELELDEEDPLAHHAVAYLVRGEGGDDRGGRHAVGTARLLAGATIGRLLAGATIGRLSVLPAARGRGIGTRVLDALVAEAAARGEARVTLYAQPAAVPFYRQRGFDIVGEPFDTAGVIHVEMARAP